MMFEKPKKLIFTLIIILFTQFGYVNAQQSLLVASYNIRNDNQSDANKGNGWALRLPVIVNMLKYNGFDIVGAQEVLHNQLTDLLQGLPDYQHIGVGRDDGHTKGEYAPIFYKKDKFKVISSGHFWLGEETERPTKGWDAALPRICTFAQLKDKKSGKNVWVFNLHLDHVGKLARENSCKLVLSKITSMTNRNDAVMLMGDFNVDQKNPIYSILNDSNILKDAYNLAAVKYATTGTFNAFDANLYTDSRIDHIFVSNRIHVKKYAVLTDTYRLTKEEAEQIKKGDFPKELSLTQGIARMPSDHFPIVIQVELKK